MEVEKYCKDCGTVTHHYKGECVNCEALDQLIRWNKQPYREPPHHKQKGPH